MLTKDLLRFRRTGDRVKPQFIDPEDSQLLELAGQLLEVYNQEQGLVRSEIEETVAPLIKSRKEIKLAQGLNKLILDRCAFSSPSDFDYPGKRSEIFAKSARLIRFDDVMTVEEYRARLLDECVDESEFLANGLYADLPENERLDKVRQLTPKELLERYNCSLVQSLLLYAGNLEVTVAEPDPAKMRRMFKYLRFFRLLARITTDGAKFSSKGTDTMPSRIKLLIDGPASLFENTQKYGLQLASFFPAVCDLGKWKLEATVKIKNREMRLLVDQKSGLVSHYSNFSAYVPEEIAIFHRLFKDKVVDWEIVGHSPFFDLGNQELVFPDLSFQHASGRLVHLELFHRWHSTQLLQRLDYGGSHPDLPLIIGVDRFLYNKPEIRDLIDNSGWFSENGFLFRDFPGVDRVKKHLAKKLDIDGNQLVFSN